MESKAVFFFVALLTMKSTESSRRGPQNNPMQRGDGIILSHIVHASVGSDIQLKPVAIYKTL